MRSAAAPARDKLMISGDCDVMRFTCSDSCETGITSEKELKAHKKITFCNGLESSKCRMQNDEHVGQDDGRKCGLDIRVKKQKSKKGCERTEDACSVEGVFEVSDSTARLVQLGRIESCLRSDSSQNDMQNSRTRTWASLAWLMLNNSLNFILILHVVLHLLYETCY